MSSEKRDKEREGSELPAMFTTLHTSFALPAHRSEAGKSLSGCQQVAARTVGTQLCLHVPTRSTRPFTCTSAAVLSPDRCVQRERAGTLADRSLALTQLCGLGQVNSDIRPSTSTARHWAKRLDQSRLSGTTRSVDSAPQPHRYPGTAGCSCSSQGKRKGHHGVLTCPACSCLVACKQAFVKASASVQDTTSADFNLPSVQAKLLQLKDEVVHGRGFALIKVFPVLT